MNGAQRFKQLDLPKQPNEMARLKVVTGPDYGVVFVLTTGRVTIGRGEDNDIVLTDLKASRRHAEVSYSGGAWTVKDNGSSNGIILNNKTTRSGPIKTLDTLTLGETTLEFVSGDAGTMILTANPKSIEQIKSEQAAFEAQQKKVRALAQIGGSPKKGAATAGMPAKDQSSSAKPKLLLVGMGIVAAYLFLNPTPPPAPKKTRTTTSIPVTSRDPATLLGEAPISDPVVNRTAEQFYKSGFREYRQGNYIRAKQLFETVLQISPGHPLANLYLQNCNKAVEDEVKSHLDYGKKDFEAGKLKEAQGHFEAVLRLQYREPASNSYVEAKDQLIKVNKAMENPRLDGDMN